MTSHTYQFKAAGLLRLLGPPLVPVALFAVLMHAGAALGLLPRPRPTLDVDRTVLIHQVEASRAKQDAEILLLGDSSCLMDVDGRELGKLLGRPVLNLGTLSYLDLNAQTALLREFVAANPNRLRTVILLLHPEALRRVSPEAWHTSFLDSLLHGYDFRWGTSLHARLLDALGLELLRSRVLCQLLPSPLPGAYGQFYGFSDGLERHLATHRGSALDPDRKSFEGSPDYRLAAQLEAPSRNLRAALPAGVKLFVGITPTPTSHAGPRHTAVRDAMLRQWSEWLGADVALTNLPATLPNDQFARTTHLNAPGAGHFTKTIADAMRELLPADRQPAGH